MPPKTKLFVGKLPPVISEEELRIAFEQHGQVTECSILGNYGFVHMSTEDEALAAIKALNNYEINGYRISVEQSTTDRRSGGGGGGRGRGGRGRGGHRDSRGGGPMRGGRGGRPGPYDRRGPPMDRYGGGPPRNGYYDDYDVRDRRPPPFPMDRRPMMPPRDPYRDYAKSDYDRLAAPPSISRRSPPMDRRAMPPLGYGRRDDYGDHYGRDSLYSRRPDPYSAPRDMMGMRRSPPRLSPPRRYGGPPPRDIMMPQY